MATYEMTFYLSAFRGSRMIQAEDENGEMEYGVFIPIERNGIVISGNNNPLTWGFVQELDVPQRGFTHRVLQKTNPAFMKTLEKQGESPILIARMKPTRFYHRKPKNTNTRVTIEDDYGDL